ncbi:hypothetical protein G9G63_06405 [Paenibacillus sp. EKM202P]|uniref:DUF5643 domain-containing protein n=1 Tax=unclassified Paenibacillus TaxID=185978 RepID=UPI0013EAC365|nr:MULTISPECIES: DUF5643 domain-containing protein [unclassified Paenibacillus]KAF6565795.1 hypothetical protein G9G63_06405 [Paenibacillus sp. EKM202P]KAF6572490.1 hypothetical protein G9G64_02335 [Paenibacillus sp. EKM207P]
MKQTNLKLTFLKRVLLTTSAFAIIGTGAAIPKNISPIAAATSDAKSAQAASSDLSLTQDGVTLKLGDVFYDGTRLSFSIEREGKNLPEGVMSLYLPVDAKASKSLKKYMVPEKDQKKGYIKRPEILIDGKAFKGFGSFGDKVSQKNTVEAEYNQLGSLPDEFEMTIQVGVTRISKPFEFKVPVKKDGNMVSIKPNKTQKSGDFSYTVKQLDITSHTTRLVLDSEGQVPASSKQTGKYAPSMMYYDIVDDQGKTLQQRKVGFSNSKPRTKYHIDELYSAIGSRPQYVTIKPYTFTVNPTNWSIIGQGKGADGKFKNGDKTYIKELEMTIPVPAQ